MRLVRRYPLILLAPIAAAGLAALLLWRELPARSEVRDAGAAPASMSLNVTSPGALCDDPQTPATCAVPAGTIFTLAIALDTLPLSPTTQVEAGYVGFQTQVFYGDLRYKLDPLTPNEIVWPDSALPIRAPFAPIGFERLIAHGDVSSLTPPLTASTHTGSLVEFDITCPTDPAVFEVDLLTYDAVQRPLGAGFRLLNQSGSLGATVPAATAGQRQLDLDGDSGTPPETVDVAASLQIDCAPLPTITPGGPTLTPTRTRTPTRTATRTPTPLPANGNVNCDQGTDSIDAALVLQLNAGLIDILLCPERADVNGSQSVDSIDAVLILQYTVGLIPSLPV